MRRASSGLAPLTRFVHAHHVITTVIVGAGLLIAAARTDAVDPNTLPVDIVQTLQLAFKNMAPEGRSQVLTAIRRLTPSQGAQAVINIRSAPRDLVVNLIILADRIRAGLPATDQQRYINGVWGGSPADQMFSAQVNDTILRGIQGTPIGRGPIGGIPPSVFEQGNEELLCSHFTRSDAPPFCAKYFPR